MNYVEKINGCLSIRSNQHSIPLIGSENFDSMSQDEKNENMEKSIQRVIDILDKTTCSHTGGSIDVRRGLHPPSNDGFKFIHSEIKNFLDCSDKTNFKSADMIDFGTGDEVTEFYNRAWRILHCQSGNSKCVSHTKYAFSIVKNTQNVDIQTPVRGSKQLHDIFVSFNYSLRYHYLFRQNCHQNKI